MKILPDKLISSGRNHTTISFTDKELRVLKTAIEYSIHDESNEASLERYRIQQHLREMLRKLNNPNKN